MKPDERRKVIDECIQRLRTCSAGFVEVGNSHPEGEDRNTAYDLSHAYEMAADELQEMREEE